VGFLAKADLGGSAAAASHDEQCTDVCGECLHPIHSKHHQSPAANIRNEQTANVFNVLNGCILN
jgi:hypothetical protein